MNVIPFNVPGLPDLDALASQFVLKPAAVDATDAKAGPRLALSPRGTADASSSGTDGDGVLCLYPGIEAMSYLFSSSLRAGQKDLLPALVVHNQGVDGSCAILAFSSTLDGNPLLILNLLPDEYLPKILGSFDGASVIDLSGIDDRLEITQSFAANGFGVVSRITNELTKLPKESGNAVFKLYDDPEYLSDVCSFYMTRTLTLAPPAPSTQATPAQAAPSAMMPPFRLLWRPATFAGVASFAFLYVVMNTSFSARRRRGEAIDWSWEYNRGANRRDNDRPN